MLDFAKGHPVATVFLALIAVGLILGIIHTVAALINPAAVQAP